MACNGKGRGATKARLEQQICCLEFVNDQLAAEVTYVDMLLREIGFMHGLETVKAAAREIMEHGWTVTEA